MADTDDDTIRKITPTGTVTTPAGLAGSLGSVKVAGSAARFYYSEGVVVVVLGDLYAGDTVAFHHSRGEFHTDGNRRLTRAR